MAISLEPIAGPVTADEIRRRVATVPRVPLALTPTPLQDAPRLASELGIGRLLIKRDDLTGLAFGGNKTRNLEFRMAEAVELGTEVFIAGLEAQSNSARQTTAAANILGMKTILVLRTDRDWDWQGNPLIDRILGRRRPLAGDRRPGRHGPDPARRRGGAARARASGRT